MRSVSLITLVSLSLGWLAGCDAPAPNASEAHSQTASAQGPAWRYGEATDEMRGTKNKFAQLESVDEFEGSIGLGGKETTTLELQSRGGVQAVDISNPNLQFTCSPFTETYVMVKFDDRPARRYACTDEKTSKYGVAFIQNASGFIGELKKAKKVSIGAEVFQRGEQVMHWDVPALEWQTSAGAKPKRAANSKPVGSSDD